MWAICNHCSHCGGGGAEPCILWVPKDMMMGMTGCPYHIHGEENGDKFPANWIAVKREDIKAYIQSRDDDVADFEDEEEYVESEKERSRLLNDIKAKIEEE